MKALQPSSSATRIARTREWLPESLDALLAEIDALKLGHPLNFNVGVQVGR